MLDTLEASGDFKCEMVFLSDYTLSLCRGCKACFDFGEEHCPFHDDRDPLIAKMTASDGVVLATPNYSFQVSARMKMFLDRLGFIFHRPRFHGKTFTALVAQGIMGGGKIVKYLEFAGKGMGFNVVKGACVTAREPMTKKQRQEADKTITDLSWRFHRRLLEPAYPVPSIYQLMMFRLARTMVLRGVNPENADYTFYRDHGWFTSDYYYAARMGLLKKAAGAITDWMSASMVAR